MEIKIKTYCNGIMPTRSTDGAIGYDLFIPQDVQVYVGRQVIPLNFSLEMPKGIEAKIETRSGFALKGVKGKSLPDVFKCQYGRYYDTDIITGKIDPDYRGNVGVILNNHDMSYMLPKGTKIAQMTFYKVELPTIVEAEELSETERGGGGFGSTGTSKYTPQEAWLNSHDTITEEHFAEINDLFGILLHKNGDDVVLHELTQGIYEQPNEAIRDLFWKKVGGIINVIEGDVKIEKDTQLMLPNATSVGGDVTTWNKSYLNLPNVTSIGGDVRTNDNSQLALPNLTSIGLSVMTFENSQLTLSNVTSIEGNVKTFGSSQLTLPNLTNISGSVITHGNSQLTLPNVISVGSNVETNGNTQLKLPNLTRIGENVGTYNNSQLILPNVISIGGAMVTFGNTQLKLPNLTSVGRHVETWNESYLNLPNVTCIGGGVITYGNTQLTLPNVTNIGGSVITNDNSQLTLPNVTEIRGNVKTYHNSQLTLPNVAIIGGSVEINGDQLTLLNVTENETTDKHHG